MDFERVLFRRFVRCYEERVIKKKGCWGWERPCYPYAHITLRDDRGKCVGMTGHRLSWIINNGDIPEKLWVLHKCDNPVCTNPQHLFLGTQQDNDLDRVQKGRTARGEQSGAAKLTEEAVLDIRRRYRPRIVTLQMLAEEYYVHLSLISRVVSREIWRHV